MPTAPGNADGEAELQRVLQFAYHIPGQLWPSELGWAFYVFAPMHFHVEIGAYCGQSLYLTAAGMHVLGAGERRILTIDPTGMSGDPSWDGEVLRQTIRKIRRDFPSVEVEHRQALSVDAFRELASRERDAIDSVFIDGDHHFAEVSADIQCWGRAARSLASGHDYWPANPGVMQAVNLHLHDSFQVVSGTRIWFVERRH